MALAVKQKNAKKRLAVTSAMGAADYKITAAKSPFINQNNNSFGNAI